MTERESKETGPTFEQLVDIASGSTPSSDQSDPTTGPAGKLVVAIRGVLESLRAASSPAEASIERAASMPGSLPARLGLNKVGPGLAQLVRDTRGAVLAGYRGATTSYSLTFETDGVEIHLEVKPSDDNGGLADVHAHVDTGEDETIGTVHFHKTLDANQTASVSLDDGGYLTVDLPIGTYDVLIELKGRSVVVPAVEIG